MTFYSIPGVSHGGTAPSGEDPAVQAEQARRAHPEFFAERDRRRREEPDFFRSGFTEGYEANFHGHPVTVEHVEFDQHSGSETLWMRGEKTGTFTSTWKKDSHGKATLTEAHPTKD